jgi:hypothetical protein
VLAVAIHDYNIVILAAQRNTVMRSR